MRAAPIRAATWLLLVSMIAGCATAMPPTTVKVASIPALKPLPTIIDARPPNTKLYREDNSTTSIFKYFGDEVLNPAFIELLRNRLADSLPAHLQNAHIELTQADIGFWIPLNFAGGTGMPYIPYGVPAAAAAVGLLLGYGIVYGIKRATANEFGVSYITITIDGEQLAASESEMIKDKATEEAVRAAVTRSLDLLAERVAQLQPGAPPSSDITPPPR